MDEWLDIYDEHQRPTGRLRRRGDPIEPGERYLVVTVFVRDSGGRFLTTRRSPQKAYYPGCWEVTSGTAQAKEDGLAAAVRELAEETGLALVHGSVHHIAVHRGGVAEHILHHKAEPGGQHFAGAFQRGGVGAHKTQLVNGAAVVLVYGADVVQAGKHLPHPGQLAVGGGAFQGSGI